MIFGDIRFFTPTFVIVAVVAVCLGLPIYLAARTARNDTPIVAAVMGFIVGAAVPTILFLAGPSADQASVGDTATVVDGTYTFAGWLQNLGFVGLFGLLGVGGALLFWFFVRRAAPSDEQTQKRCRRRHFELPSYRWPRLASSRRHSSYRVQPQTEAATTHCEVVGIQSRLRPGSTFVLVLTSGETSKTKWISSGVPATGR